MDQCLSRIAISNKCHKQGYKGDSEYSVNLLFDEQGSTFHILSASYYCWLALSRRLQLRIFLYSTTF